MVVDGDGQGLFRFLLTDDVVVKKGDDIFGCFAASMRGGGRGQRGNSLRGGCEKGDDVSGTLVAKACAIGEGDEGFGFSLGGAAVAAFGFVHDVPDVD